MCKVILKTAGTLFLLFSFNSLTAQLLEFKLVRVDSATFELNQRDIHIPLSNGNDFYFSDEEEIFVLNLGEDEKRSQLVLSCLNLNSDNAIILRKDVIRNIKVANKWRNDVYFNSQSCKYALKSSSTSDLFLLTNGNLWKTSLREKDGLIPLLNQSELYDYTYLMDTSYISLNYYKDMSLSRDMQNSICLGSIEKGHTGCEVFNAGDINYSYFNRNKIADFSEKYLVHGVFSEPIVYLRNHEGEILDSCVINEEWIAWKDAIETYDEKELRKADILDSYGRLIIEAVSKTNVVQFVNDSTVIHSFMTTPQKVFETLLRIREDKLYPIARRGPITNENSSQAASLMDDFLLISYYGNFYKDQLIYLAFENGDAEDIVRGKFYFYKIILK
jgi:hypothetical protein